MSWDPFYRIEKQRERLSWDPHYRAVWEYEHRYDPEIYWKKYEEKRNSSEWLELYYENPMDLVLRKRHETIFRNSNQGMQEETMKTLELFETISMINKMYNRGLGFWLSLVLKIGALGFLAWFLWNLLSWRLPIP